MHSVDDDPDDIPFRSAKEYIAQWKHNRDCLGTIERKFVDWQVTVTFYAALHAVNAAADLLGEKPRTHVDRNKLVKFNEVFAPIRTNYLALYRMSRFTRYDPMPESWLPVEWLNMQLVVDSVLKPIENNIETILKRQLKLQPIKVKP